MSKILVAVDGSEHAALAAAWASRLADQTGSSLTLLYVCEIAATETMGLASQSQEEIDDFKERRAVEAFKKTTSVLGEPGAAVDTIVVIGDPAEEIIRQAKTGGHDHIVMANRGLSPVQEILLGSVSEKVTHEAHCPVTIFRA